MSSEIVCVLIVEDEAMIATLMEVTLVDEGLVATVAYSGKDALTAIEASPKAINILVIDIRIGGAPNGWAVAHAAREANPAIGVIYVTADSMDDWRVNGVPESVLIIKPFVPAQIVTAVMTLLNQHSAGSSA